MAKCFLAKYDACKDPQETTGMFCIKHADAFFVEAQNRGLQSRGPLPSELEKDHAIPKLNESLGYPKQKNICRQW